MVKGWHQEYERHALAGMGIKTGRTKKPYLFFEQRGVPYVISTKKRTLGQVVRYGNSKFDLPHKSWKITGFAKHYMNTYPTISVEEAIKNPEKIKNTYVFDEDYGTSRRWGGGGEVRVTYAKLRKKADGWFD